ncbi:MAG TPA: nicotinate (nicotinamide) nucleotide adenylyltransferase [Tepidisphaeraceae bacterium]|jgi:nicotinate-nucleotide adenylyltransferase
MTKICFGGSFNPLHVGHLVVARAVSEARGFDQVVLIPTAQPPHKPQAADLAAACHRLGMCQAVANHDPLFSIEPLELYRRGPSYTMDTITQLRAMGWQKVSWLIGADMLQILPTWHRAQQLLDEVEFVIVRRPGSEIDWSALPPPYQKLRSQVVDAPLIDIRATDIRQRVQQGKPIRYLVPPEVERYIGEHRLYSA